MAKYDRSDARIAPNLDCHLVFPLLEFLQERQLYIGFNRLHLNLTETFEDVSVLVEGNWVSADSYRDLFIGLGGSRPRSLKKSRPYVNRRKTLHTFKRTPPRDLDELPPIKILQMHGDFDSGSYNVEKSKGNRFLQICSWGTWVGTWMRDDVRVVEGIGVD
ncbi:hypothetical protein Scep_014016 [Stephania cephalantha]|uniref:Eukaryotic translation initiation factor 3 subunit E N-terminal domain-containing protein n=1 Tax=Stephania cephalantha TaxID=152367 RepID=A0AAP0P195_9MAGN